jgi:hypothetical protein
MRSGEVSDAAAAPVPEAEVTIDLVELELAAKRRSA